MEEKVSRRHWQKVLVTSPCEVVRYRCYLKVMVSQPFSIRYLTHQKNLRYQKNIRLLQNTVYVKYILLLGATFGVQASVARPHHAAMLLGHNLAHLVLLLRDWQNRMHKTTKASRVLSLLQSALVKVNGHMRVSVVSSFVVGPIEGSAMSCEFYSR